MKTLKNLEKRQSKRPDTDRSKGLQVIEDLVKMSEISKPIQFHFSTCCFQIPLGGYFPTLLRTISIAPITSLVAVSLEPPSWAIDEWREITVQVISARTRICMGWWGNRSRLPTSLPQTCIDVIYVCSLKQWGYQSDALMTKSSRIPVGSSCKRPHSSSDSFYSVQISTVALAKM